MNAELLPRLAELGLSGALIWSLVCRARLMDKDTPLRARMQHASLMAAAVFGPLSGEYSTILWAAGVTAFLILEKRSPVRQEVARTDLEYVHVLPRGFKGVPR